MLLHKTLDDVQPLMKKVVRFGYDGDGQITRCGPC